MKIKLFLAALLFSSAAMAQDLEPKGKIKEPKGFGDKMHNAFLSKRMKEATYQRDSMHQLNLAFNKDTTERGIRYRELEMNYETLSNQHTDLKEKHRILQDDYNEMNDKYTALIRSSLNKTEQLNLALKEKGEQLLAREKKLAELEDLIRKQDSVTNALNNVIKNALLSFKSDEISVEMKNGKVYVSMTDKLLFRSGSADVEDKGKDAIKTVADILNKNKDVSIMIEGHTDNVPIKTAQFKDNWDLSVARATNIVRLLDETYKVDAKMLTAAGRGEYVPKASNETTEGRAKNRRTEIILTPKLDELYKLINKR
ncbi:MAG: OmpA family protein [bacterium]|nr:OmpA family protein [bacterium]